MYSKNVLNLVGDMIDKEKGFHFDFADEVVDGSVRFAGEEVTVTEEALVLVDGMSLDRLVSGQSFWFAWYGNFPDTTWWPEAA